MTALVALVGAACGGARPDEPDPRPPLAVTAPAADWEQRLAKLVAVGAVREHFASSTQGRSIDGVRLRGDGAGSGRRPTLLVVAGLDARHTSGVEVVAGVAERVLEAKPAALGHADIVVVPCVNPDGMARFLNERPRRDDGTNAARRGTAREDADRDRRIDEDGPVDLNGDGLITQMRVKRPLPGWLRGASATEVSEPESPRLMRRAEASKGEAGEWAVLTEGRDQDGDGLIAEDGPMGVDLEMNFPYHWPEFDDAAGPVPLSEPETRGLAEWVLAHPEVVAVLEYAPNDNLAAVPAGGKMDATGEAPQSGTVLDDDRPLFELVGARFRDATHITGTGGVARSFDGSLQGWAYAQVGVLAFVTPAWVRPDLVKVGDEKKDDKVKPDTDDARWLALSDARVKAGGESGFVEWKAFEHPQLGTVEVGGWVPGFRLNPPAADLGRVRDEQARFVGELAGMLPRLRVEPASVERLGERTWRVRVAAVNEGRLPTRSAMGVRTRRLPDTRFEVDLPAERVVGGARAQGSSAVAPGGSVVGQWVVTGAAGSEVKVRLLSPEMGDTELTVRLEAGPGQAR